MPDYYTILGVPKSASQEEIKKGYRKLAHQYHPDKQGGDEAKFKEINTAYQVLSDPKKRSQYDQFGSAEGFAGGQGGGFDGFDFGQGFGNFSGNINIEDIFDLFGGAFGGQRREKQEYSNRGRDIGVNLTVSLYDVARGATKEVELTKDAVCQECKGSGGTGSIDCPVCKGEGEIKETTRSLFGNFSRVSICHNCHGTCKIPKVICNVCKGEGKKRGKKEIEIKIPAGINSGDSLILRGEGEAGYRGGNAGDLYVKITVTPDKIFKRVGNDITYQMSIKLTDALLGARLSVPTLDGEKGVEIHAGIQDGDEVKIRGAGVWGSHKGDQVIKVKINIPKKLNGKAKKLVEELAGEL